MEVKIEVVDELKRKEKYWRMVEAIPKIVPINNSTDIKMDFHGLLEYLKRTGKKGNELTDEELAMFVDDLPKLKAFMDPYCKAAEEFEKAEKMQREEES